MKCRCRYGVATFCAPLRFSYFLMRRYNPNRPESKGMGWGCCRYVSVPVAAWDLMLHRENACLFLSLMWCLKILKLTSSIHKK